MPCGVHAAVVEFVDGIWVDPWWERQGRLDEAVLEFGDEFRFPI
jgi:hypothetical protein